jgi:hypothetical protein
MAFTAVILQYVAAWGGGTPLARHRSLMYNKAPLTRLGRMCQAIALCNIDGVVCNNIATMAGEAGYSQLEVRVSERRRDVFEVYRPSCLRAARPAPPKKDTKCGSIGIFRTVRNPEHNSTTRCLEGLLIFHISTW